MKLTKAQLDNIIREELTLTLEAEKPKVRRYKYRGHKHPEESQPVKYPSRSSWKPSEFEEVVENPGIRAALEEKIKEQYKKVDEF